MEKKLDNGLKIGLALSGRGTRAGVFHAGILKAMAKRELLDKISFISSVSGGSIVIGLIFIHNNYRAISKRQGPSVSDACKGSIRRGCARPRAVEWKRPAL